MRAWIETRLEHVYERVLAREISGAPTHVAIIQDGNRRYARKRGKASTDGHREGAKTTEDVLRWCRELGIEELTLYAFSTENFSRPAREREALFDLLCDKLEEFADSNQVHDEEVCIRAIGELDRLPNRVQNVVEYAETRTREYDQFRLNIALAYGGRAELLGAATDIANAVADGALDPSAVGVDTVDDQLYDRPVGNVDLIIRTGGDERTSNFLPWHANGNEAAVVFCSPFWPEFSKIDFLRAIRTYQSREESWRRSRAERALALIRAGVEESSIAGRAFLAEDLPVARSILARSGEYLPSSELGDDEGEDDGAVVDPAD